MFKDLSLKQIKVLAGCFICMFLIQGCTQAFSIYLPQIALDTGWKVSKIAITSTTAGLSAFFFNMLLSKVLKKLSPKAVLLIGCAFTTIHLIGCFLSSNVYMLWFFGGLCGIAIAWGTAAPCTIIITNWFEKNRSQFVAATVAGAMFGSVVVNPLAAKLIDTFGWRKAYLIQGTALGGLAALAVIFLVSSAPESGAVKTANSGIKTVGKVKKDAKYWLLAVGLFLIGLSTNTENYLPAFWQSRGMSNSTSSYIMSFYALSAAIGSILMSKVNDSLGGKKYVLLTSLFFCASILLMAYTGVVGILPLLLLCVVPLSLGGKKSSALTPPLIVNETFGRENYSSCIGFFAAMLQLGVAASNIVIAPILEYGYPISFTVMSSVNIIGMLCIFFIPLKKSH